MAKISWRKKISQHKRIVIAVIALILLISFSNYRNSSSANKQKASTVKVERSDLTETLVLSGAIDAREKATLTFQSAGRLSYVGVKEGDYVGRGQTIAALDKRSVQKNLQKELNSFLIARWDLDQVRDDNKDKAMTDSIKRVIDKTQFSLNNEIINVELQQLAVEFSNLATPISGIVTRVDTPNAGINITPASAVFEVVNPKTLFFSASVDQNDVARISEGMKANISVDAFPQNKIEAVVDTISFVPKSGETGTVYDIKLKITKKDSDINYRIGMTGDVEFITRTKKQALSIPITSLKEEPNGKKYVLLKKGTKQEKRSVKTGLETEDRIEILQGLSQGDVLYD